jgi:hypothetical protein
MWPQSLHLLGSFSANNAIKPSGKKQTATIICHVWKPPFCAGLPHLVHEIIPILLPLFVVS